MRRENVLLLPSSPLRPPPQPEHPANIRRMAKWYYTVIVGTQPGVYVDWTQAAPKVIEISGAIHKKFRTLREAHEAYNKAAREGALRVVEVDPVPDAESPLGSQGRESALFQGQVMRPTFHSAAGLGHRQNCPMGVESMTSIQAGPSRRTERTDHVIDAEPREHHGFSQQQSRPADGSQAHRPTGTSYRAHSNESRQESQYRSVRPLPRSSRADSHMDIAREEARSASISPERRWRVSESPSAAHPRSPQLDRLTHRVMRSPQVENYRRFPENFARQHDRPPGASPLADGRQNDIGPPQSSDGFSFSLQSTPVIAPHYGEPPRASGSQGPMRRESVQSPDTYLDSFSFDRSETQRNAPSPQTGMAIGDSFGPLRQSPALSHISLASSDETASVFSFDVNLMVVGSLGRSAHFASLPAPQPTVSPSTVSSSVENAIPGPSTQNQEGPNEEENGGDSQASSDETLFETAMDHTSSPQADRSNAFNDSPSLSRPLSPLMVASTSRSLTHLSQSIRPSGFDTTTSSSPRVWPWWVPSLPQHGSPESSRSTTVTGLGLSIEGTLSPSPLGSHPPRHRTTTQAPPESPLRRLAGNVEGQSPTRSDAFLRDVHAFFRDAPASSQALASPPHLGSGASNLTPRSGGARSMNAATPSPRNVPLPSSPPTFTTPRSSPARLQAQPSHRTSPCMPFYPSLTIDDDARGTPPGLDVAAVFERPTPRLSPSSSRVTVVPAPVPVASRTPSADPRSPISRLARLPGSIMEISRNLFFGRPTPPMGNSDAPIIP